MVDDEGSNLPRPDNSNGLIAVLVGVIFILLVLALSWLNWMFEESDAELVDSISGHINATSVLGIFAHPDDEQLVTGLLIRAAEDANTRTAAITATKGEAGTPLPQVSRLKDLGWIRKAEALKNTWALGVEYHQVLDFPDGGVDQVPLAELVAAVTAQLLAHRPDLVVTFWPESGYSDHADHKRMGLAAEMAILQLREFPQQGYAGPVYIAYILAPTRMMNRFAGEMGQRVVDNQPAANYAQDGEAWAKIRGWKIHASQRDYVQHAYGLPAWLVHRLYDKEHYYLIESSAIRSKDTRKPAVHHEDW
jgi:LmbE family N-acetylglucosaminyl deacetylase